MQGVAGLILYVLLLIFLLLFITVFLKLGLGFVESENSSFGSTFLTALIGAIILWVILIITPAGILWLVISVLVFLLIFWLLVNARHKTGYEGKISLIRQKWRSYSSYNSSSHIRYNHSNCITFHNQSNTWPCQYFILI
jgi:predicted membrane protein